MKGERHLKVAVRTQYRLRSPGNIFMDVPTHLTLNQIEHRAQDRQRWKNAWFIHNAYDGFKDVPPVYDDLNRQPQLASDAASAVVQALNQSQTTPPPDITNDNEAARRRNPTRKARYVPPPEEASSDNNDSTPNQKSKRAKGKRKGKKPTP